VAAAWEGWSPPLARRKTQAARRKNFLDPKHIFMMISIISDLLRPTATIHTGFVFSIGMTSSLFLVDPRNALKKSGEPTRQAANIDRCRVLAGPYLDSSALRLSYTSADIGA